MFKIFIFFVLLLIYIFPKDVLAINDPLLKQNNIFGMSIINHSDLKDAETLVNSNGGEWGYVKVVIREDERDVKIWQSFFDELRRKKLIPIIRIATVYNGENWVIPEVEKLDEWVDFLNSLNWVIENRYVIIGNEPNHSKEWGGKIEPEKYAEYLRNFSEKLKKSNSDYFILNAGFDQASPNSKTTMDQKKFIERMINYDSEVFNFIDGWNSHSYPNPGFSSSEKNTGRMSIQGYKWEMEMLKSFGVYKKFPIFITETGWIRRNQNEEIIAKKTKYAFEEIFLKDENIVVVTPFVLNYIQEPFYEFSWKKSENEYFPIFNQIKDIQKIKGEPLQKFSGEIVFNFLNPLMFRKSEYKGYSLVKNTGQSIWEQSEAHTINELGNGENASSFEIKVSNTKFNHIEPFSVGLVIYTINSPQNAGIFELKLGFYVKGEKIGDVYNGKIITF